MPPPLLPTGMKLNELCERIAVDYDQARYTLARGLLPRAIAKAEPGRGNHRIFDTRQAFHLALCLKLKEAGVTTALAAEISDWSRKLQGVSQNLGWDSKFAPFAGQLETQHQWYLEVGDAKYARLLTDANPSKEGLHEVMPWTTMTTGKLCETARPAIMFRIDLSLIAAQLLGSGTDQQPS